MKQHTICWAVSALLLVGWVSCYFAWRIGDDGQHSRLLINNPKQWYIGRDGKADARADIRDARMKLYGGGCGDAFEPYEMSNYRRILREGYAVELTAIFEGDVVPDKYVLPYSNSYNALITGYLQNTYGPDIMERIMAEAKKAAEIDRASCAKPNTESRVRAERGGAAKAAYVEQARE